MGKLLQHDNPVMEFLGHIGELIIINFLFLLCCVPVITFGPSLIAMETLTIRAINKKDSGNTVNAFFMAFKDNFKKGIVLGLITFAIGFLLMWSGLLIFGDRANNGVFMVILWIFTIYNAISIFAFMFTLAARFENTVRGTIRNAVALEIGNPLKSILADVILLLPLIMWYCLGGSGVMALVFLWVFIGFAVQSYAKNMVILGVFEKYKENS